ncbi:MAG: flavin reductase family protein [Chloroflexi bacterium]|nr:flavin reductase family protein [Chloroflexota bacterium]
MSETSEIGARLRAVMRHYPTGVTIVSTSDGGNPHGMTVNSFTSVSLDPPLVLVCIAHSAHCNQMIKNSGCFAVSILGHDQADVSSGFADNDPAAQPIHEFRHHRYELGSTGSPLLAGAVAHLDCRVQEEFEVADHTVFVGLVEFAREADARASLVFFDGKYART